MATAPEITTNPQPRVSRRPFVARLLELVPEALVVTGLGAPSYDVFAAGDRDENFYLWGAMGGAVSVGLGLALAQPERSVLVITGDGEMLMGIGSLATVGVQQPANLSIVVLDNGHYGETGMQPSHTSQGVDLAGIARASGIADSSKILDPAEVGRLAARVAARSGPLFAQVLIDTDEPPRALPSRDGVHVKNRFRAALGLEPF
ncbi:thiamine pyrophosphate-dependent enzyme [Thermocrispum sp.]|uniref:thiamine pyrophosphate-dependent enzyme n=1 Tax=Thermocrispum sp. TaxID=2060768 RepID=UPI0025800375|nr:thiamine pyrophosphate-dependent enzyme [Thermocrispum sp.]